MTSEERHGDQSRAAEERRQRWSDLPSPVETEEMTTEKPSSPPPPDLVDDPDREFFIRHAGGM